MASKYAYMDKKKTAGSQGNLSGLNRRDKQTVSLDPRESDGSLNRGNYQTTANQYGSTGRQTAQMNQTPASGNTGMKTAQMGQTPISGNTGSQTTGATAQARMQALINRQKAAAAANARAAAQRDAAIRNPQKDVGSGNTAYTSAGNRGTQQTAQMGQVPISGSTGPQQKGELRKYSYAQMGQTPISGTAGPGTAGNGTGGTGGYTPSDTVQQAQTLLQEHMANAPGAYSSQYADQIQQVMNQITNRRDFSYDMNRDALYRQYADQYTRQAQMAMMDTMGQAAALTGGYGNSYAQTVGQQTFQNYMQQLNDVMPELYQLAADQYAREGEDLMNQYGMLVAQDEQAYGRYRDQMSDYDSRLQRLTEDARYAYEQDYGRYLNDRDYQYQKDRDTVGDQQWQDSFDYQKDRDTVGDQQWQDSFDYQKDRDTVGDQQWQDSFNYQKDRDAVGDNQWQQSFDEDRRRYEDDRAYQEGRDNVADEQWEKSFGYQQEQDDREYQQWLDSFNYQKDRDAVGDDQWERQFAEDQQRYDEEWAYQKDRDAVEDDRWQQEFAEDQRRYDDEWTYREGRDAVEDDQWERQFAEDQQRYDDELAYREGRDAVEDDQWERQFAEDQQRYDEEQAYREGRDAVEDERWQQEYDEDQRRYNQEWDRQVLRDQEDDERWAAEFEAAQDRYNDSVSSGNSDSGTEAYEMSVSDYKYWNEQWGSVTTEAQAEALAERMEAAGVPFDLVALWYKEFSGGYEPEKEPGPTDVEDETPVEPVFSPVPGNDRGFKREYFGMG